MPVKTVAGVKALGRIKGFEEFLTRAEKDRLERMRDANLFEKYLPYAIALGFRTLGQGVRGDLPGGSRWYVSEGAQALPPAASITPSKTPSLPCPPRCTHPPERRERLLGRGGSGGGGGAAAELVIRESSISISFPEIPPGERVPGSRRSAQDTPPRRRGSGPPADSVSEVVPRPRLPGDFRAVSPQ